MVPYLLDDLVIHLRPQIVKPEADAWVVMCAYFGKTIEVAGMVKPIKDGDVPVGVGEDIFNEIGADKAGAACDEDFHLENAKYIQGICRINQCVHYLVFGRRR